jgi:hypothetical protein
MPIENTIQNWSYKKVSMYRKCPMQVRLKYIDREPEPEPNPKYEEKRLRGIKAHDDLEACINLGAPIPAVAKEFETVITGYIELGAKAEAEEFFDDGWKPWPDYKGHWLQVKKDVNIVTDEFVLTADWKTGRRYGNEVSHYEQMKLYAVTDHILHPGRPEYIVELQYLDQRDTWTVVFTPDKLEKALVDFDRDVDIMMNDTWFRPRPNRETCKYCPYSPRGTGSCPVGV